MAATGETNKDISAESAKKIVTEAATWKGTPYQLLGAMSVKSRGGDCSGTTCKIYGAAGLAFNYSDSGHFASYALSSGLFREVLASETRQDGDILSWSSHMAIYCSFAEDAINASTDRVSKKGARFKQINDMWTAFHSGGDAYGPFKLGYFRTDAPRVFRYQK
jgi:cell wall-associated NlpC family hydrolase